MKRFLTLYYLTTLLLIVLISGCAAPVIETVIPTEESTSTNIPTKTATLEPTLTLTPEPTLTPTLTPTPEPVLWCSDVIEGCYFLGNEIARIFAVMTLPCFENGGECYPPVEECNLIPPSVVHILVEDFAQAWKSEVEGNPKYVLLNPDLYDSKTEYCFVDEGVAQMIRDSGNDEYVAMKSCLDNEKMPCDIALSFWKVDCEIRPLECSIFLDGAYLTDKNYFVNAVWLDTTDTSDVELTKLLNGEPSEYAGAYRFAYVLLSTSIGFSVNNDNPPADIFLQMHSDK